MAVTQKRAEAVLAQVEKRFSGWIDEPYGPKLHEGFDGAPFAIIWEEGPTDWAIAFTGDDSSEEERSLIAEAAAEFGAEYHPPKVQPRVRVKGVFEEPIYGSVLGLYSD